MKRGLIIMLSLVMFGFMSCDNGSSSTSSTNNDWGEWSSWSEWVVTTPATSTAEGVETRTRTRTCNNTAQVQTGTETRPIPVLVPVVTMSITVTDLPDQSNTLSFGIQDQETEDEIFYERAAWPVGTPRNSVTATFSFFNVTAEHLADDFVLIWRGMGAGLNSITSEDITLTLGSNTISFNVFLQ